MESNLIAFYTNGNSFITIDKEGTRIITYPDNKSLHLEFPLNIDIKLTSYCSFGYNSTEGKAVCSFCHESATTSGKLGDLNKLKDKLEGLPPGIELAIGGNQINKEVIQFIEWCKYKDYIVNLTVNSGHTRLYLNTLLGLIDSQFIKGLGISYRPAYINEVPQALKEYEHTILHVIAGIDSFQEVLNLKGYKKLLVLGEKDFGFNEGKVSLNTLLHKEWFRYVPKLFNEYKVVSFDNLALEQLKIQRLIEPSKWTELYQGEYSMYINVVDGYFSPNSRSLRQTDWNTISIKNYFRELLNEN